MSDIHIAVMAHPCNVRDVRIDAFRRDGDIVMKVGELTIWFSPEQATKLGQLLISQHNEAESKAAVGE